MSAIRMGYTHDIACTFFRKKSHKEALFSLGILEDYY